MKYLFIVFSFIAASSSLAAKTPVWDVAAPAPFNPIPVLDPPVLSAPINKAQPPTASSSENRRPAKKKRSAFIKGEDGESNLPSYYRNRDFSRLVNTSAAIIVPNTNIKEELYQVHQGDELKAVIDHSIIAFPDETAPVIAKIRGGNLDGAKLIGESKLEPNTKRIFITFQTIVYHSKAYGLKANALNQDKQNGFEGEYHSNESGLFAGDFISSTVAAYFDGLVPRQTNVFGGTTADSSVDSALKKGASGGAMASAERFKEKLKKTPQYAELEGPILIEVLMLSKAIEN